MAYDPDLDPILNDLRTGITQLQSGLSTQQDESRDTALALAASIDALAGRVEGLEARPSGGGAGFDLIAPVSPSNSASANGAALRQFVQANPGRRITLPAGVIEIDTVRHPEADWSAVWLDSGTTLVIPEGTILRFMGPSAVKGQAATVPAGIHRLVTNRRMGSGGDERVSVVGGGVIDGNSAGLTFAGTSDADRRCVGVAWWRARHTLVDGVTVQNVHSENGSTGEGFSIDAIRCQHVRVTDVLVRRVAGRSATGISTTHCFGVAMDRCWVDNMEVQGFTMYGSRNVRLTDCWATRNKRGFNFEYVNDNVLTGCVGGGIGPRHPGTGSAATSHFANGDTGWGNTEAGMHVLWGGSMSGMGGTGIRAVNCIFTGNPRGVSFAGAHTFTAASGTNGTTIAAPAGWASPNLIGTECRVNNGPVVKVTTVTGNTITTNVSHGGTSGQLVRFYQRTELIGCTITDNQRGIQFLGPHPQPASQSTVLRDCTLSNTVDLQDAARTDTTFGSLATATPGTDVSAFVGPVTTARLNPLPFDLVVTTSQPTAMAVWPRGGATATGVVGQTSVVWPAGTWLTVPAGPAQPRITIA